ncbi:hypothetical protein PIB30_066242 [Stylosanthes scabra]|uniref:DUF4283 domain-containing protein n=1 Tax=Stylosanthes scabra TaxID=79078 RepID=A0ABU6WQ37_9FABA|nr:hypothetical protein [Stylosanthes scabra]
MDGRHPNQGVLEDDGGLEDEGIIVFGEEDVEESIQICAKSLIGRILADRAFSVGTVEGAMRGIWSQPDGFNCSRWNKKSAGDNNDLTLVPIWIQLWEIPEHYKTKELVRKIRDTMGKVLDVDFFSMRGNKNRILKVQVLLDATNPLKKCLKIVGPNKACTLHLEDSVKGELKSEKWGSWLKAEQSGWRIDVSQKENSNPNIPKAELT